MAIFYVYTIVTAIVFVILTLTLIKLRFTKGPQVPHFHKNFAVELVWTFIPFLILIGLSIPAGMVLKHSTELHQINANQGIPHKS